MKQVLLYIHGKGGNAQEASRYRPLCPAYEVVGVDYQGELPWQVGSQLRAAYEQARRQGALVTLLANSIGAYFAMDALQQCPLERALFVSPILDMEQLILDMMGWASVPEETLREQGEIPTNFGETLTWRYLCYVREHPIRWDVPTAVLYAGKDNLTARQTVDAFVLSHRARLTVMENGEHWFHTAEQLAFLDSWLKDALAEPL